MQNNMGQNPLSYHLGKIFYRILCKQEFLLKNFQNEPILCLGKYSDVMGKWPYLLNVSRLNLSICALKSAKSPPCKNLMILLTSAYFCIFTAGLLHYVLHYFLVCHSFFERNHYIERRKPLHCSKSVL